MSGGVRLHEEIPPGDAGTLSATVPWMQKLIREGEQDPLVRAQAVSIVAAHPELDPLDALFRAVRSLPYKRDEDLALGLGAGPETVELLQGAPLQVAKWVSLGSQSVEGDCDDRTILLHSLAGSLGYQDKQLDLVRGPGRPDFSHVYGSIGGVAADTIMDGKEGRPFFGLGQEVGAGDGARGHVSVPVEGGVGGALLLAAALWLVLRRRR